MKCVVIADEITAVGWRLAGAEVWIPAPDAPLVLRFDAAQRCADLLLITAELAARLPTARLQNAQLAERPLVLVIADLQHRREPPDVEDEVRHALGVAV